MYTARTRYTNLNPSPEKTSLHVLGSCARPVDDFNSIQASLDKVDVRAATCLSPEVTEAVLDELEQGMGVVACNTLVVGLLRTAGRWSIRRGWRWRGCRRPSGGDV